MHLYKTTRRGANGEVFFGFSRDYRKSIAFTTPYDFSRIVDATKPDLQGRATIEVYPIANWARRIARILFSGPRLRSILRSV